MKNLTLIKLFFTLGVIPIFFGCGSNLDSHESSNSTDGIDWKYQVDSLLMPYWMTDEAMGEPPGNFPNYRNNIGEVVGFENFDFNSIPESLTPFLITQPDSLRRSYIRMNSRQVYTYCIAYHLTGNEEYLHRAKIGVDYLLDMGGYNSGSPFTYWQNGKGMPDTFQRTTQDLAYSLTGPTMYYYLTRDEDVLKNILQVKEFVLSEYYEKSILKENSKLFMWVKEDFEDENNRSKQLLAVLDQLNAYLVLITPILPDTLSKIFLEDVKKLSHSLKNNFYDEKYNLFWGNLDRKVIGESPTDFGHSIKSFWMLYIVGKLTQDFELTQFAKENGLRLLETAYLRESGSWAGMYQDSTLAIDRSTFWWSYAELDQMAATISLVDTTIFDKYLSQTYRFWNSRMIDHVNGEVFVGIDDRGNRFESLGLKVFHWKNGFHSLEHALIGYLSTSNYNKNESELYYAFNNNIDIEEITIRPYYFEGNITDIEISDFDNPIFDGLTRSKIRFEKLK